YVTTDGSNHAHAAAHFGQMEALRILQDAGANLSHAADDGLTPAHKAAGEGRVERPLHGAAERDTVEVVRKLVEKGAEVDAEDGEGRTALTVALAFGQEGVARALLEAGAGVNAGTGQRPLHGAAKRGTMEVVKEFMEKGVEVDVEDREGCTALTVALAFGQEGVARALLEAGAGVNVGMGRRPLHAAAEKGTVEMVRELVEKGAEVDAEDREGRTALTVALAGDWRFPAEGGAGGQCASKVLEAC
ncbi:hypothetical protein CYMTET_28726, partial [Cymbomonas tetramitiformis]